MYIALTILVFFARKAALSEVSEVLPEQITSPLNTLTQFIERLNSLSIDPPTLNPLEDPWIRLDKEIEFTLEPFPSDPPRGWTLDTICQKKKYKIRGIQNPFLP